MNDYNISNMLKLLMRMENLDLLANVSVTELDEKLAARAPEGVRTILMLSITTGLIENILIAPENKDAEHWISRLVLVYTYYLSDFNIRQLGLNLLNLKDNTPHSEAYTRSTIERTLRILRRMLLDMPNIDTEALAAIDLSKIKNFPKTQGESFYKHFREELFAELGKGKTIDDVFHFLGITAADYKKIQAQASEYNILFPKLTFSKTELRAQELEPIYNALTMTIDKEDTALRAEVVAYTQQVDIGLFERLSDTFAEKPYTLLSHLLENLGLPSHSKQTDFPATIDLLRGAGIPCLQVTTGPTTRGTFFYYAVGKGYIEEAQDIILANREKVNRLSPAIAG